MKTKRLDIAMVEKGLSESRSAAQRLIMEGNVRVNDQVILKASHPLHDSDEINVAENPKYVSRGGEKLEDAFQTFELNVNGLVCADVGASTGGFTDCLLQHGAVRVYAIDVGYGILHWKLRSDPRVITLERQNARYIERLPEPVNMVTIDASFISLDKLLPVIRNWFNTSGGEVVTLIKPQFEAGRQEVNRGEGVITDRGVHYRVVLETLMTAQELGFEVIKLTTSPLKGPKGNIEFLAYFRYPSQHVVDIQKFISEQIPSLPQSGKSK
jgi:23S rRNA (cytidine1920-2'-O)/16S rRNA (cytidine1409-2'-O)-methyltransferase